ncbi:MAG: type II toxin-antitoxin system YhaV family toxin [Betaproteobacteria bacterium]
MADWHLLTAERAHAVADAKTDHADAKRAYESGDDVCRVFWKMLASGYQPTIEIGD